MGMKSVDLVFLLTLWICLPSRRIQAHLEHVKAAKAKLLG
jgi:hypothetical protein